MQQRCAEEVSYEFYEKNILCVAVALVGLAHASIVVAEGAQQLAAEQSARLLSAFFGLDNKMPFAVNLVCIGAWDKDGMPVVLATPLADSLQAEDFRVVQAVQTTNTPKCVTLGQRATWMKIGRIDW